MSQSTVCGVGVKVRVVWKALVWEAFECGPCQYGVYAMGPAADMDTPEGCLLGTYASICDASDAASDEAELGMWPDSLKYWVEVRNLGPVYDR